MFSGEIYYNPLIKLTNHWLNIVFFAKSTALLTQLPLGIVGISRWQKGELSVFKAKK